MGFNFSRLKNWLGYENLTTSDINSEFNNIINKAGADTLSGANSTNGTSPSVSAMQVTESPGDVGTEVVSSTTQEDVRQLRYQLNAMIGGAQWYSPPPTTITVLNNSINALSAFPQSRIVSGRKNTYDQPMFLVPSGSSNQINLKCTATNFVSYFNNSLVTFSSDLFVTGMSLAPSINNTCTVNDANISGTASSKLAGEYGGQITISGVGSNITAANGTYAAFKTSTEYFIAEVDTSNNRLKNVFRGVAFNSTDTWQGRVAISNGATLTLMKLTYVFATYNALTPALAITYNLPTTSYSSPASPAIGDYWYDLGNNTWKVYNGTTFSATVATFVGVCIQDTSNCVAARSADFFNIASALNTIELEYYSASQVRSKKPSSSIAVYGTQRRFDSSHCYWTTSTTLDSGTSLSASTSYYCYVTDLGDLKTSDLAPTNRSQDLLGYYHPAKPWRCVGGFSTDGSSNIVSASVFSQVATTTVNVRDFGASGNGVNDDAEAIQKAINSISYGEVKLPAGSYLLGTELQVPDYVHLVGEGRNATTLKANANSMNLIHHIGSNGGARHLCLDGNSKTGCTGLRVTPLDETQTATTVQQNFNVFEDLLFLTLAEGIVLKCGPLTGSGASGCFYNTFVAIHALNCIRGIWMKGPPNAGGSAVNRNSFYNCRIGSTAGPNASNTGVWIDSGSGNNFYGLYFEGIQYGATPSATPTGLYIKLTDANAGDNNQNRFFGGESEATTVSMVNANTTTELYGCGFRTNTLTATPFIMLGGDTPSNVAQILPGYIYQGNNQISPWASNAIAVTNGQVQFPGTQVPSTNATTLDDYQEGTFTPAATALSASGYVYTAQNGYYQKVGKWVHFTAFVTISSASAQGTNSFRITGLPYQSGGGTNEQYVFAAWISPLQGFAAGTYNCQAIMAASQTTATIQRMYELGDAGSGNGLSGANLNLPTTVFVSGSYRASA